MSFTPEPGLVIRYDFLWKHESDTGQEHGRKDRPCAIILVAREQEDGSRKVLLCPITHTPPAPTQNAVPIPKKVAAALGFDSERCWIKTHEANELFWEKNKLPFGVSKASEERWTFGTLPYELGKQAFDRFREHREFRRSRTTRRNLDQELGR